MNLEIISQLVRLLKESPEVGAIEIRRGWFGAWTAVRVSKAGHGDNAGERIVAVQAAPAAGTPPPPAGAAASTSATLAPPAPPAPPVPAAPVSAPRLLEIKSPMVGTFYAAPSAEAGPYVKAGSQVSSGQVVCIIEAMKIMNEIEAEVSGVIREVCVENAQPVDFGQVLFRVDPNG